MVSRENKLPDSPCLKANLLSRILFWWLNGFMGLGYAKELEPQDLYQPLPSDRSSTLGNRLSHLWNNELTSNDIDKRTNLKYKSDDKSAEVSTNPKLLKALLNQFGFKYMSLGILLFIEDCFTRIAQPVCLGYLIRFFGDEEKKQMDNEEDTLWNKDITGYILCSAVVLGSALYNVTHHSFIFGVLKLGMQIRIACCSLIYRKALRLNQRSLSETTVGKIVNLLSNDVNRFDSVTVYIHYLWLGILQVILIHVVLWIYVGESCLVGLAAIAILTLFQGFLGRLFSKIRKKTSAKTDHRVRLMNEIINSIAVIKMYCWEKPFSRLLDASRQDEVKVIRSRANVRAVNLSLYYSAIKIIVFVVLLHFALTENSITAEKVFVVLSLYNNISILWFVSESGTSPIAEAIVSINRIQKFLLLAEHKVESSQRMESGIIATETNNMIKICNASASWEKSKQTEATLENINLSVKSAELVAVIGRVGSFKSSLLQMILGEMPILRGSVNVFGTVGYVSQEPWIFSGTVRENILFGKEFKIDRYNAVVEACALRKDFNILTFGDHTDVGEKGTALSGGQKARISLARAVYSNADVYLLDDPLSAVDATVGHHIFNNCIKGLLASKAIVLVTHQTHFAKQADRLYQMNNGKISIMEPEEISDVLVDDDENSEGLVVQYSQIKNFEGNSKLKSGNQTKQLPEHFDTDGFDNNLDEDLKGVESEMTNNDSKISQNNVEFKSEGNISGLVYWKYFRAGSNCLTFSLMIIFNILAQLFYTGSDYWLNVWSSSEERRNKVEVNGTDEMDSSESHGYFYQIQNDRDVQLGIFGGSVGILLVMALLRSILFIRICMNASIQLHHLMFKGVLGAPMKFFQVNPVGRILNRFSKDIGNIDDILPTTFLDTIGIFLNIFGIVIVTSIVSPILLVPASVSLVVFYFLRSFYLRTARAVKRIEGNARSPCFSHLSNSMIGLTTIRSYKMENEFEETFDMLQDVHTSAYFLLLATSRWFGIWLDWISVVFIAFVTFSFMIATKSAGEVGLAISSAMLLTGMLQWGARQSAEVENQMVAVERVLQYTKIHSEESDSLFKIQPPAQWPSQGEIEASNLGLTYGVTPVLKNISFKISPGEKIGIVGRTSLLTALFRLAEPTGNINIDGLNILTLPLASLRSKMSIIPQEPVLFATTLRNNLDPEHHFTDSEIWQVLTEAGLKSDISASAEGLDAIVSESGTNFSVGQRQLICLARAILKRNKIIILDEATANLDSETDALIQKTIGRQFHDCTVLTVAHRLGTVMKSNRVIVLDSGEIKEFDAPYTLLQNKDSAMSELVRQTGRESSEQLIEVAKRSFFNRNGQERST